MQVIFVDRTAISLNLDRPGRYVMLNHGALLYFVHDVACGTSK